MEHMQDGTSIVSGTLGTLSTVFYYILFPLIKIFQVALFILSPFWTILSFVLLPVTTLLQGIWSVLLFPLRWKLLQKFETIYIFLGIGAIIGVLAAATIHLCFNFLSSVLSVDSRHGTQRLGRTAASYRATREKRKARPAGYPSPRNRTKGFDTTYGQPGLLSQTIIEEGDSEF
ncbi:hypothetical protein GQ43DRAFT_265047 [Delitschia confertaspora ATCC 74209]|uniref:Uncharacterized protein n=1 Tax=Delitschia confertaspora ATCC 74209 TaxID=1513339 RepID=A0A9P4MUA3_9PLEO|nr:hypothetical protein GQ43DRAFT_265047 [Delitschia confertaspora ATCC 74209]